VKPPIDLEYGDDGWVTVPTDDGPCRLRFVAAADGRFVPVELHLATSGELRARTLRVLPLARIEAVVNAQWWDAQARPRTYVPRGTPLPRPGD